ncbi:TonB-dependent receptor [Sphingobium sp.]|uniref:TonB-dependent receptor n=1 Tax=Sphingobium sp. TaxID=1912891 RepID=UPI00257B2F5F|nr:TonB-dependent receptor [Sphingobium sp.]
MAIGTLVPAAPALAADERRIEYSIEAGDLGEALKTVSRLSGKEIIFNSEAVLGKTVPRLHGTFSADEAVQALLEGTGLTAQFRKDVIIIRGRSEPSGQITEGPTETPDIIVTGSRIRGGEATSPVISASRSDIEQRGFSDLGAFVRVLPQNFGGGQNPGVFSGGGQGGSTNLNSSSNLNLRGLGPDATLTLLNGHRVAYDGVTQGVDISAIPVAAIEKLEIVPDGSSALYGSDAVGGVANVILRRKFSGLTTSARVGTTTEGGGTQQQYNAVSGTNWNGGGVLGIIDYQHSTAITARQRSFVTGLDGSATLIPGQKQISGVVSGYDQLLDGVRFNFDGQYSRRSSSITLPYSLNLDALTSGSVVNSKVETFSLNPSLNIVLPKGWELTVSGGYGESTTNAPGSVYQDSVLTTRRQVRYHNTIADVEAFAEGPLARLPGGNARLVVGGGFRETGLKANSSQIAGTATTSIFDFDRQHKVSFAFGELSLPWVGPDNAISFISQFKTTAAVRYENYQSVGDFLAPRLGAIYVPFPGVTVKFNWGKSFKAPTLYSQYRGYQATLLPASYFGPSPAPDRATILYTGGANSSLRPEQSENWTATLAFVPKDIPKLKLEASYYHINYKDRVGTPITSLYGALTNPIYSHLVSTGPSAAQIDAFARGALFGLENFTGAPYDPASVYAVVENVSQNTARQTISGVDLSASYELTLTDRDILSLSTSATYIKSERQLVAGTPFIDAAGTIFNPPHWRAQGGANWQHSQLTLSGFANYVGGTLDNRLTPFVDVGSFLSVDFTAQWQSSAKSGPFRGIDVIFSISNAFDERPAATRTTSTSDPSFDTTNYPANGRTVSIMLRKAW